MLGIPCVTATVQLTCPGEEEIDKLLTIETYARAGTALRETHQIGSAQVQAAIQDTIHEVEDNCIIPATRLQIGVKIPPEETFNFCGSFRYHHRKQIVLSGTANPKDNWFNALLEHTPDELWDGSPFYVVFPCDPGKQVTASLVVPAHNPDFGHFAWDMSNQRMQAIIAATDA